MLLKMATQSLLGDGYKGSLSSTSTSKFWISGHLFVLLLAKSHPASQALSTSSSYHKVDTFPTLWHPVNILLLHTPLS